MSEPAISYLPPLVGQRQVINGADRPICAAISALAFDGMKGMLIPDPRPRVLQYLEEHGIPGWRAHTWAAAVAGSRYAYSKSIPASYAGIKLDDYQIDSIKRLTIAGGVLALGCGLGKTVLACAACDAFAAEVGASRIWIVCPLNAVPAWERMRPYLSKRFSEVAILSMDSGHKAVGVAPTGGCIIFDEAHLLGEPKARRTQAAHTIRKAFDFGLCLTGTLLHGGVHKALSILDLAVPGAAVFSSQWKAGEFFNCLARKKVGHRTVTSIVRPTGAAKEAFAQYLSTYTISLTAYSPEVRTAFHLPQQHIKQVRLSEPWDSIDGSVEEVVLQILDREGRIPHMAEVAHLLARANIQSKVDWIMENLDDEPVVIFAQYIESLDHVEAALLDAGIPYVRVDGEVTGAARSECEQKFRSGSVQVFLGQMTAASVSMNLQTARFSIAVDHSWRAADYSQALARTARRGQEQETYHWDLLSNQFQAVILGRLLQAQDFDASLAEWQQAKLRIQTMKEQHVPQ